MKIKFDNFLGLEGDGYYDLDDNKRDLDDFFSNDQINRPILNLKRRSIDEIDESLINQSAIDKLKDAFVMNEMLNELEKSESEIDPEELESEDSVIQVKAPIIIGSQALVDVLTSLNEEANEEINEGMDEDTDEKMDEGTDDGTDDPEDQIDVINKLIEEEITEKADDIFDDLGNFHFRL